MEQRTREMINQQHFLLKLSSCSPLTNSRMIEKNSYSGSSKKAQRVSSGFRSTIIIEKINVEQQLLKLTKKLFIIGSSFLRFICLQLMPLAVLIKFFKIMIQNKFLDNKFLGLNWNTRSVQISFQS